LVWRDRSIVFYGGLAIGAGALTIVAVMFERTGNPEYLLKMLLSLWLAWVFATAICVRAFRIQFPSPTARRWSAVIGAMATTIPWLGFSAASIVGQ